jgi:hydroxymethylbilane synthase
MTAATRAALRPLRLGTRASALALAQSGHVADEVSGQAGREVTLVHVSTAGDRDQTTRVAQFGGTGVFVSALRDALLAGEIDFAVHSYKDLPTASAEGLVIAAVPPRADPRDALIARNGLTLEKLPAGARVGTGAVRRIAQLLAARPDLVYVPIRGNVDTRLGKVTSGELDAVVLAVAGLARLGRGAEITEAIDPDVLLPAPAQGALAVECRADDPELVELLAGLDDLGARAEVTAERALLAALEAGCSAPVAAHARAVLGPQAIEFTLRARVAALDGSAALTDARTITVFEPFSTSGLLAGQATSAGVGRKEFTHPYDSLHTDVEAVGRQLAAHLLANGADTLMGRTA